MKKYLAGLLLAMIATGAAAVDGYKGVKFGSSFDDLQSAKLCDFERASRQPNNKNVVLFNCLNFQFADSNTMAAASFIDDKFSRLVIVVDNGSIQSLYGALSEKYGEPSFFSSSVDVQKSMTTGEPVYIKFDNDTVIIKVEKVNGIEVATLIYSAPDFDQKISEFQKNKISDDI